MTVEDTIGCPYMMDEEDERFLRRHNARSNNKQLSEDDFENIMHQIESTINEQLPHLNLVSPLP